MVSARHLCGSLLGGSALSRGLPTGRFIHLPHLLPLRLDSSPDKEFSLPSPGMVGSSQVTNEQTKAPREVRTGTNSPGGVVSPSTWEETEARDGKPPPQRLIPSKRAGGPQGRSGDGGCRSP